MNRPSAFVILADDSARWRVAGLSQLDRLILGLDEWIQTTWPAEIVEAVIFWDPDMASAARWLPRHPRMTHVRLTEAVKSVVPGAQVLDCRLFVQRNGITDFFATIVPFNVADRPEETAEAWTSLREKFKTATSAGGPVPKHGSWRYLNDAGAIIGCEKEMLGRSGKSQDGIVSRFLNRPLSRMATRYLLRYDLGPTTLTLYLFVLPVFAFFCLARGDYAGIVAGALLFQLYSVLDGCDGEIARATYRESRRGGRIDDFLDMLGSLLFVIGLGLGLFRTRSSLYLLEGLCCAGVIATNEWSLRRTQTTAEPDSTKLTESLYPRHRRLFAGRGLGKPSDERFLWWLIQFTKRDVAILFFLILALIDQSPWILHLWLIVSASTLALSLRSSAREQPTTPPGP